MRSIVFMAATAMAAQLAHSQGGSSGAPSALAQTTTPQAASAADRSVERRHQNLIVRRQARPAQRASRSASSAG
jgi:hypothetical protein